MKQDGPEIRFDIIYKLNKNKKHFVRLELRDARYIFVFALPYVRPCRCDVVFTLLHDPSWLNHYYRACVKTV